MADIVLCVLNSSQRTNFTDDFGKQAACIFVIVLDNKELIVLLQNKASTLFLPLRMEQDTAKRELIYDGLTFSTSFHQDQLSIKHSIVISCQKAKYKSPPRLVSQLRDLSANGIEIVVHIKEQGFNEKDLVNFGIEASIP